MTTDKIYKEQVVRLESSYNYSLATGAVKVWKEELDKECIKDSELVSAIDSILRQPDKYRMRPNLGDLLSECLKAQERNYERKRHDENKLDINKCFAVSDMGKRSLTLIKLFLKGEYEKDGVTCPITKRMKVDYMLKMEEMYPGVGWDKEAMTLAKHLNVRANVDI